MKILHIGLASSFTEGMLYQDNMLAQYNVRAGHEVIFISDCHAYQDGKIVSVPEEDRILENGMRLIRLAYDKVANNFITNKIQKVSKLKEYLVQLHPDVILYHGVMGYGMLDVAKYVREHPDIIFYMDSHEDFHNTANTWLKKLCYLLCYKRIVKQVFPVVNKILYVSFECKKFLQEMYDVPKRLLEFYPLGGIIIPLEYQTKRREYLLKKYNLSSDSILCAHSGKMSVGKRTRELLEAFIAVPDARLQLFVFGSIPDNQKNVLDSLIASDKRIHFLGWRSNNEITDLLAGIDVYCQPGTQSATFQMALCCGCAAMVYPYSSHKFLMDADVVYVKEIEDIKEHLEKMLFRPKLLKDLKKRSFLKAQDKLDYKKLAERLCH